MTHDFGSIGTCMAKLTTVVILCSCLMRLITEVLSHIQLMIPLEAIQSLWVDDRLNLLSLVYIVAHFGLINGFLGLVMDVDEVLGVIVDLLLAV
jgi:hypothetical protein